MPNKSTERRWGWLARVSEALLIATMILAGWACGFVYVEGSSMEPALSAGDMVVYRRWVPEVEEGQLVLFSHGGSLVVHRVDSVRPDGSLRTKGDANATADAALVPSEDVRGEVVLVVPLGALVRWLAGCAN